LNLIVISASSAAGTIGPHRVAHATAYKVSPFFAISQLHKLL